ncbi:MAG: helix-turn-helix domain-containing protein [Deltaproteobacteria bacterium]|nr:helix-turn-helix domain-containing protein [Deltaproteobacteria bacterium]
MTALARYPSFDLHVGDAPGTLRLMARAGVDASRALDEIARAHASLSHPAIAPVTACDASSVTFASEAHMDLESCIARAEEHGDRVPYAQAIAFVETLASVLSRAHSIRSEARPFGYFLGGISLRSFRVRPDGRFEVFGFGHNFVVRRADGTPVFDPGVRIDERPPSATSDLSAALGLIRSLTPIVAMPPRLARLIQGERLEEPLAEILDWAMHKILSRGPKERSPTVDEAMAVYRVLWRLLGVTPDHEGLHANLRRYATVPPSEGIALDGDRVLLGSGRVVELATRGAARRMLLALAEATRDGRALSTDELFAAGWPGQRLDGATRSRRVRVELSRLRSLGLRDAILHGDLGFTLRLRS